MNDCRPLCVFTGQSLPFPFVHLCSKETAILMSTSHILLPLPLGCEMYWWKQHILWFRSSEKQLRKVAIQRTVQLSLRVPEGGKGEAQGKCRPGEPRTLTWGGCWGCIRDCKTCGHRGTMAGLSLITLEETKEHFWGHYERPQWLQLAAVAAGEAREGCAHTESSQVEHESACLPMSSVLSMPHWSVPFPRALATVCPQLQWAVVRQASQPLLGKTLIFL